MPRAGGANAMGRAGAVGRQLTITEWLEGLAQRAEERDPARPALGLFNVVLALSAIGLLIQASHASTTQGTEGFLQELLRSGLVRIGGIVALLLGYRCGPRGVQRFLPLLVLASGALLVLCYVEPFSVVINGSRRWVDLGWIRFQPSEVARIVVVLWVADRCVRLGSAVSDLRRGVLPMLALTLTFFLLVLCETDLGGALLLLICALSTMWVGGARLVPVAVSMIAVGGGALTTASALIPYIRQRVAMWFGTVHNDQVSDAVAAIASGGWLGVGLGQGTARNAGVPYLESDYVFAQVGEELGLFGLVVVLGLILSMLWFSLRLVLSIRDRYDALAAFGLLTSVGLQAMIHVQVVSGLAPPKGTTLPFISAGGTSLLVSSLAVGLALGAARRRSRGL